MHYREHSIEAARPVIKTDGLADLIAAAFGRHAGRAAVVLGDEVITYRKLRSLAVELASDLQIECGEGGAVGILAQRTLPAYVAVLAAVLCRRPYVALNMKFPLERQLHMARMSRCSAFVADSDSEQRRAELLADLQSEIHSFRRLGRYGLATLDADGKAPAYVMFTSGTTGAPKGVAVTRDNLLSYLIAVREIAPLPVGARCTQLFDLSFDLSVHDLLHTWCSGGAIYPMGERDKDPIAFARRHRLTAWFSVPSAASMAKRFGSMTPGALPDLELSLFCGEPLPRSLVEEWRSIAPNSRVLNLYGPTEATIAITAEDCSSPELVAAFPPVVPLGRPFSGAEAIVVAEGMRLASVGETGELWLGGPQVAAGYLANEELTAQKFVRRNFNGHAAERWYRTGDLVERSPDHGLAFKGRVDDQVKIRGYRVEILEIEEALRKSAETLDVAAVPWPVYESGAAGGIVGFVCNSVKSETEILSECANYLPSYMTPTHIYYIDSIPLNSNGKVDRKKIQSDYLESNLPDPGLIDDPRTTTKRIVDAWSSLFPNETITPHTRFCSIDCDSLAYVNAVLETESLLGGALPDDWGRMSVADLAATSRQAHERSPYVSSHTLREMIAADTHRVMGASGWRATVAAFRSRATFRPIVTLRLCAYAKQRAFGRLILPLLSRIHHHFCRLVGIDLPYDADIGPGLLIIHGWGVVVNAKAVIGSDVTLLHGATIGQVDYIGRDGRRSSLWPAIGDSVWVGPYAMILGCKVGAGSRVLGGAFVTKDVPPRAMVSGNPLTIVEENVVPDVINPASRTALAAPDEPDRLAADPCRAKAAP